MSKRNVLLAAVIAFGLFLIVSGSAQAFTAQRIIIPYTTVGNDWWAGLAIHNASDSSDVFNVAVYDDNGNFLSGKCHTIPARAIKADLLKNLVDNPGAITGRVSIYIQTTDESTTPFYATLFMGNLASSMGFGLQAFTSQDYETPLQILCIIAPL